MVSSLTYFFRVYNNQPLRYEVIFFENSFNIRRKPKNRNGKYHLKTCVKQVEGGQQNQKNISPPLHRKMTC